MFIVFVICGRLTMLRDVIFDVVFFRRGSFLRVFFNNYDLFCFGNVSFVVFFQNSGFSHVSSPFR